MDSMERALREVRRAAEGENREDSRAAYEVGYEKGFLAGWEAAETEAIRNPPSR
jgi:hypothetical protein